MNDMPTITITIEEYMHLRACENKCNAEDYRSLKDIKELLERKAKALDGIPIKDGGGACIGIYFSIANDLPGVYPRSDKLCDDCISRNEVDKLAYQYLRETTENHVAFYEHLLDLPSVTPKSEKPSGKWIPVSERLPKAGEYVGNVAKYYLVQNEYGDMLVARYTHSGYWEQIYQLKPYADEIVAWMPLPKAYREVEE